MFKGFFTALRVAQSICHHPEDFLGKQRSSELGFANPNIGRNHSPTVRHERADRFQVTTLLRRNGNEVVRSRATPVPNFAAEFEVHCGSLSNALST
jgi:hypothetical protein